MSTTHLFDGLTFINCVVAPVVANVSAGPGSTSLSDELTQDLRARGGKVVEIPTLTIAPVAGARAAEAQQHLNRLAPRDWLAFTSGNAVRALSAFSLPINSSQLRVATVGEATKQAAEQCGFTVELVAPDSDAESLGQALLAQLRSERNQDSSVYFLRGETVASGFERALFPYRERLKNVVIYQSHRAAPGSELISQVQNLLREDQARFPLEDEGMRQLYQIFTSGQSLRNYLALICGQETAKTGGVERIAREIPSCVIGKHTAEVGRELHMNVVVIPDIPSRTGMIETLETVVFHERALYK